jgi:hypothetical protein
MRRLVASACAVTRILAVLATLAILASAAVWAQSQAGPRPVAADCPGEPALFHPCALKKAGAFDPPRTTDGVPDLQGFWRGQASGTENVEEHPMTDDDDGGKSLVVDPPDGRIPYQAWAASRPREHRAAYVEPNVACFPSGVPRSLYVPTQIEFLQTPGSVLMLFERAHTYRVIPTTPRPHVGAKVRLWMGDSRGRWEGNTLVVDVTNHNAKAWFDQAANFYTAGARMVERFTLIDQNTMHYQVTIEDANVYTRPWTMAFPLRRNTERGFRLLEEACHEGERNTDALIRLGFRIYPGTTGDERR